MLKTKSSLKCNLTKLTYSSLVSLQLLSSALFLQSRAISRSNKVDVKEGIKYNSIESSELRYPIACTLHNVLYFFPSSHCPLYFIYNQPLCHKCVCSCKCYTYSRCTCMLQYSKVCSVSCVLHAQLHENSYCTHYIPIGLHIDN